MSAEVETMAYAGEVPWHGLGMRMDNRTDVDAWIKSAGLDWTIERRQIAALDGDGAIVVDDMGLPRAIQGKRALIRSTDGRCFGVASEQWQPWQNAEMLRMMRDYVVAGGAEMETAGSLYGGKVVWGLARLRHSFEVASGDVVNGYLLLTTSHEVGRSNSVRTTTVRVVCRNTMEAADRDGSTTTHYVQSHRTAFNTAEARLRIEAAHDDLAACERRWRKLHALKLSLDDSLTKVLGPVFAPEATPAQLLDVELRPRKVSAIVESLLNAPGATPGTAWGTLQGITHWADHVSGRGGAPRLQSAWLGANARAKLKAEAKLLELAE